MSRNEEEEALENLRRDAVRKQHFPKGPKKMADVMSGLMARKGFARVMSVSAFTTIWQAAVGEKLASQTRTGELKRGVLEITVRNSAVLQELTFAKSGILKQLTAHNIRDLRMKVGPID